MFETPVAALLIPVPEPPPDGWTVIVGCDALIAAAHEVKRGCRRVEPDSVTDTVVVGQTSSFEMLTTTVVAVVELELDEELHAARTTAATESRRTTVVLRTFRRRRRRTGGLPGCSVDVFADVDIQRCSSRS